MHTKFSAISFPNNSRT
jgi:hypothetical protein